MNTSEEMGILQAQKETNAQIVIDEIGVYARKHLPGYDNLPPEKRKEFLISLFVDVVHDQTGEAVPRSHHDSLSAFALFYSVDLNRPMSERTKLFYANKLLALRSPT